MFIAIIIAATVGIKSVGNLERVPIIRQIQDGYYTASKDSTEELNIGMKKDGFNIAFAIG
jgi:hypothetical protein